MFRLGRGEKKEVGAIVPLGKKVEFHLKGVSVPPPLSWEESLRGHCRLETPDPQFRFLYDAALRTLVLHTPGDAYPGPYTYKRFWFRDAAFILHGLLCAGLADRAERVIDRFPSRQTPFGYFLSQEGEWDSNGEALWTVRRWCELTGRPPKDAWKHSVLRAGQWILRKRLPDSPPSPHAGLLPAGFSAEHLGPNDYYYWDDFWGIAGLEAAAFLAGLYGEEAEAAKFRAGAADFSRALEASVARSAVSNALPASPYRRLDAGSIGSLAGGYPLKLWRADDPRLAATADFLVKKYFVQGGFFQEISHSGINQYLTLHVAQVLLRAGDPRCFDVLKSVARLASPTGQWPEAIHPRTGGGCMGDGQHVWASAEWLLAVRNCFVREEESENTLILCSGVPREWAEKGCSFGPAPTTWGPVSVRVAPGGKVEWEAAWRGAALSSPPRVVVRFPGGAA
jgi:hypothetical protein